MFRQSYEFTSFVNNMNSQTKARGNKVFLAIKYYPMLGPFTDTWDDLVDDNGAPLHFGILRYNNSHASTFRERVKPRVVKAALVLLTYLRLEHHTVEDSMLFDSAMLLIKDSSEGAGVHYNSFGKPNRMFAWFVIDFLSILILFDTFIDIACCLLLCLSRMFLFLRRIWIC